MSRQVDESQTKHVRVDRTYHQELKVQAALRRTSIRKLVEYCIAEVIEKEEGQRHASDTNTKGVHNAT